MLTEVSADNANASVAAPQAPPVRSVWWVRLLSRIPLSLLYGFARFVTWLALRFYPYREHLVRENLAKAFPQLDEAQVRAIIRRYYAGFADMLVEIIKSVSMPADELRRRVRAVNIEAPHAVLASGQSVLLVAAHQCNWEWLLLALSLELGFPLDAAYKPLVDNWAEREMKKLRTRFGARLVPAKDLLADIIRRRDVVRAVAMVADQEPTTSEHKYWTRFLGRDTAFYMGPEEIARVTHFPVFFISLRRTGRGYYEIEFKPLASAQESLPSGALTERYARLVEEQIHAAPPDWPWSHKRWKLKRSLYQNRGAARPAL
jgi:Kdo2-lipid IVA lauroyltransferase/acyltransferase